MMEVIPSVKGVPIRLTAELREVKPGKWLVAVYRELDADGFIITAFLTRRVRSLEKRLQLWP